MSEPRFNLGNGLTVTRWSVGEHTPGEWYCYQNGREIHHLAGGEPKVFASSATAMAYLKTVEGMRAVREENGRLAQRRVGVALCGGLMGTR